MGARETTLRVLTACRNNHAWADAALKAQLSRDGLVGPEAALCSRLVYGVVQNQLLLDFYLSAYCSRSRIISSRRCWKFCVWALTRSCIWIGCRTAPR